MMLEDIYYAYNPWWEEKSFEGGVLRKAYLHKLAGFLERKQIEVIIGGRRTGKTTLLKQLAVNALNAGFPPKQLLYLALDHPALASFSIADHIKKVRQVFLHARETRLLVFLDEIQERPSWEQELKAIYDLENIKLLCTGSTSSLISAQGGKLTGRQIITQVYPLQYSEFLEFKREAITPSEVYKHEKLVETYLHDGGYPENALHPDAVALSNFLSDIIARDIMRQLRINKPFLLMDLFRLVSASMGSRLSFNKLAKTLQISLDTAKDYIEHFASAFLVKAMEKWSPSPHDRIYSSKKFYLMDTGFKTLLSGKGDLGAKAENAVFLKLMANGEFPGYWAESEREVDFVIGNFNQPLPIEVKYIDSLAGLDKKLKGLKLFFRRFAETKQALVITKSLETEIQLQNRRVKLTPLWKYLLA